MSANLEQVGAPAELADVCEVVALQVGPLAATKSVEISPRDEYEYRLDYDGNGNVTGARSWRYNPETDERTFTRFDASGKQLSRFVRNEQLGSTYMYDGDNLLESSSHRENDGKTLTRNQYESGKPTSTAVIDFGANTHTLTLHQSDGTHVSFVTEWFGPNGWTNVAPAPAKSK